MPVRLPKPLHGWRQFAGEVGIIVIGVLIALVIGAKAWQDSSDSADARGNIRAEIGANLGKLSQRARTQPCIERRLDEIDTILSATEQAVMRGAVQEARLQNWRVRFVETSTRVRSRAWRPTC